VVVEGVVVSRAKLSRKDGGFANDVRLPLAGKTVRRRETRRLGKTIVRWKAVRAKQTLLSYQDPASEAWGGTGRVLKLHDREEDGERDGRRERGGREGWVVVEGRDAFIGVAGGGGGRELWNPIQYPSSGGFVSLRPTLYALRTVPIRSLRAPPTIVKEKKKGFSGRSAGKPAHRTSSTGLSAELYY
jgi:hypothetical protein